MIPRLPETPAPASLHGDFLAELRLRGFEGGPAPGYGDRPVSSTDDSIYRLLSQAVAFSRGTDDLVRIARVAAEPRFAGPIFAGELSLK